MDGGTLYEWRARQRVTNGHGFSGSVHNFVCHGPTLGNEPVRKLSTVIGLDPEQRCVVGLHHGLRRVAIDVELALKEAPERVVALTVENGFMDHGRSPAPASHFNEVLDWLTIF